eukprot:784655-Pelagomonas_calceolata.AAC.2
MALTVTYAAPTMKHCSEEATWVHRRLQLCSALCDKFTKLSCWDTACFSMDANASLVSVILHLRKGPHALMKKDAGPAFVRLECSSGHLSLSTSFMSSQVITDVSSTTFSFPPPSSSNHAQSLIKFQGLDATAPAHSCCRQGMLVDRQVREAL